MKNAFVLLLTAFLMAAVTPAQAAYVIKKAAHEKKSATPAAIEKDMQYETPIATPPGDEAISDAVDEFRNLPRAERQERVHAAKDELNNFRHADGKGGDINTLLLVIIAILLPPLAVGLYDHGLTTRFWLDLLLTLLFYIPGLIYALIVILS